MAAVTSNEDAPRIIAIGSGKGGVGKSLLTANLGIFLATLGKRVVLLDAAFGAANLHTFVGVREPERALSDMLANKGMTLDQVVVPTPVPGLGIISGQRDPAWAANPKSSQLTRLRAQLSRVDADYVILDVASGTRGTALDLWLSADYGVVLVAPEPTSIELGYRFIRSAFLRRLRKLSLLDRACVPEHELREYAGGVPAPLDLLQRAKERGDDELAAKLELEMQALRPHLLLNLVRSKSDIELGHALAAASARRFGLPMRYLGHLEYDDAVWVALRRGRPLLIEHPEARVSKCIEKVTRRLLGRDEAPIELTPGDSHYELLELQPTATDEEIRRANRGVRQTYGRDSIAVAGLYTTAHLEQLHKRFDAAYDTLMDPQKRLAYNRELFPEGMPTAQRTTPLSDPGEKTPPAERPPMPELAENTDYTGALMQEIRMASGLDLREISERTKIGMGYLAAIEAENWPKLPAVVYVRGFLVEYARMLELDVERVLETYLERYREVRAEIEANALR